MGGCKLDCGNGRCEANGNYYNCGEKTCGTSYSYYGQWSQCVTYAPYRRDGEYCKREAEDLHKECPEQFPINAPAIAQDKTQLFPVRKAGKRGDCDKDAKRYPGLPPHCSEEGYEITTCA